MISSNEGRWYVDLRESNRDNHKQITQITSLYQNNELDIEAQTTNAALNARADIIQLCQKLSGQVVMGDDEQELERRYQAMRLRKSQSEWALRDAARNGQFEVVHRALQKRQDKRTIESIMFEGSKGGHLEIIKAAQEAGARDYFSCLCVVAEQGDMKCFKQLLKWSQGKVDLKKLMKIAYKADNMGIQKICGKWGVKVEHISTSLVWEHFVDLFAKDNPARTILIIVLIYAFMMLLLYRSKPRTS